MEMESPFLLASLELGWRATVLGAIFSQCGVRPACLQALVLCTSDILLVNLEMRTFPLNLGASQVALVVKNLPANAGDMRDVGSVPGSGRSPGGESGNPLPYSCLENPMDRGTWRATVHGVEKSRM